jgi:Chaperone of endosialidase
MALFKDDPPAPPNPTVTAGAQTASNVSTAIANAFLNNTNQTTPLGTLKYDQTSTFDWQDPVSGAVYSIPRFTATQQLGPTQAETLNQSEQAKLNIAHLANTQSNRLNDVLGGGIDLSQVPAAPALPPKIMDINDLSMYGPIQGQIGPGGAITRSYGPADNFSADRARVEQALNARLDPQLAKERARYEQQLADQGIRVGSPAYTASMADYQKQVTDARLGVVEKGGAEQKLLNDIAAQRAGFENAAQQQEFNQLQARGQFTNMAQQQAFTEAQNRASFFNAAAREHFFTDPAARRKDALTEAYALRNQPINEISALLSSSQVQQPTFRDLPQTNIPTTDVAGITNQSFQNQLAIWQQQNQNTNQLIGGALGAIGNIGRGAFSAGGFFGSDERIKENIHRIGTVFAAEPQPVEEPGKKKLPIYEYSYKGDPSGQRHVGPMAQDMEKVDPSAVRSFGGVKHINASRMMGSILRAA